MSATRNLNRGGGEKMKKPFTSLVHRIGHRGSVLLFLAMLDFLYGYSILADKKLLTHYGLILPLDVWAALWIGVGAFLLTGVFTLKDRWHYGVASTLKVGWASAYINVALTGFYPRAWVTSVIWYAVALLLVIISSWPEMRHYDPPKGWRRRDE